MHIYYRISATPEYTCCSGTPRIHYSDVIAHHYSTPIKDEINSSPRYSQKSSNQLFAPIFQSRPPDPLINHVLSFTVSVADILSHPRLSDSHLQQRQRLWWVWGYRHEVSRTTPWVHRVPVCLSSDIINHQYLATHITTSSCHELWNQGDLVSATDTNKIVSVASQCLRSRCALVQAYESSDHGSRWWVQPRTTIWVTTQQTLLQRLRQRCNIGNRRWNTRRDSRKVAGWCTQHCFLKHPHLGKFGILLQ